MHCEAKQCKQSSLHTNAPHALNVFRVLRPTTMRSSRSVFLSVVHKEDTRSSWDSLISLIRCVHVACFSFSCLMISQITFNIIRHNVVGVGHSGLRPGPNNYNSYLCLILYVHLAQLFPEVRTKIPTFHHRYLSATSARCCNVYTVRMFWLQTHEQYARTRVREAIRRTASAAASSLPAKAFSSSSVKNIRSICDMISR